MRGDKRFAAIKTQVSSFNLAIISFLRVFLPPLLKAKVKYAIIFMLNISF